MPGQLIAFKRENILGANVFSSVTGVAAEVTEKHIAILAEERQSREYLPLKSDTPLGLVEEAGIVGLGGAGFPTYAKLAKPFENGGTVIVNGAECEPVLSHNIAAVERNPEKLLRRLEIVMQIVRADRGVIAVKEKHGKAINRLDAAILNAVLKDAAKGRCGAQKNGNIRIALLPDMYPMGEERAVIREVLGQILPVDSLPFSVNVLIINVETTLRINEAVDLKKPLIDKDLTVGGKIKGNQNLIQVFEDVP